LTFKALAFLFKYQESLGSERRQEADYNSARFFDTIGMFAHAISFYERALEAPKVRIAFIVT
jgi:hypothetical protein